MPDSPPVEERPADAPYLPAVISHDGTPAFMQRAAPLIDTLPERWVSYLAHNVAQIERGGPEVTRAEVGMFVELCATYQLDPFAKEAWLAKSKSGKLLVMVGRDGLRKIAQRNGLHVDGDVVREKDTFKQIRSPDGNRTVEHSYGAPGSRGDIVGAWAEAREGGPGGKPMGYFFAALSEYKPRNASEYSPWSKQTSVMILGAAERQAIRQGTPLGGLVAFGEHEAAWADETADLTATEQNALPVVLPDAVDAIVKRAEALGHAGLANRQAAAMATGGQSSPVVGGWIARARAELDAFEAKAQTIDGEATTITDEPVSGDLSPDLAQTPESAGEPDGSPERASDPPEPDESDGTPDPGWPSAATDHPSPDDVIKAEREQCTGAYDCPAAEHIEGCFGDQGKLL